MSNLTVIIFGASGAIGRALVEWFLQHHYEVYAVSRSIEKLVEVEGVKWLKWNGGEFESDEISQIKLKSIDALVWAQGLNFSDDIQTFNISSHSEMYEANVTYILSSLQSLLNKNLLADSAKLCVISSIWQNLAKQNKLSYCITKSALQGLVQSLAIDLGAKGFLVNAVLPGALDTPMTRLNLAPLQLHNLEAATPLNSLATLEDVCNIVGFLCSQDNTGITGQFVAADRGFSNARII